MKFPLLLILCFAFILSDAQQDSTFLESSTFSSLKFRNIGPALTAGRIADIAVHPDNHNIMYVAVGSGNVWKTENAGTTWSTIFENYGSYSIGCITIDPNNPSTIWLGTGENVGGRHVGFGDGIYLSHDAGKSWKNMGLKASEHISKIIVHPKNANVVWVAAQGPLWSKGGERGLYMTEDGGKTWNKTLGGNEWTGVTDLLIDPRDPNVLYAATWQRHRNVAALMGGGPDSGLHKSTDGGKTWAKLKKGLPASNLGKTGMAISPFNPDIIYAAIETDRRKGGLYISRDRGASWTKQSDMISGGTGPHYYQELYADPHQEGKLWLMNNYVLISEDHGKTYYQMNESKKHVDSHAIVWRKNDPNYVMIGTDGGIYESYDKTKTWRFFRNLPITQFYKVAVDDATPFYNVYGGTQDNGSLGGPSRTLSSDGILSRHWKKVLGADGHQSATEPGNPNITYGEFQQGELWRIDHRTGETVSIKPQADIGEPHERYNWDAPILVSAHDPTRLYFASYRVWRSDNRGDEWTAVSEDLTRNERRIGLPIMGQTQSWDNPWDVYAMSNYNTITSLGESPLNEDLLYAGTDDGIIQVTEDGGANWRKVEANSISGLPATAFVNDIRADLHDENTVYACFDNHKYGDFKPYFYRSKDKGRSWQKLSNNLPERTLVWRMVQDHVDPELLFLATEFGIYFSKNGGGHWTQLKGGLPTIAIRDITIQRRENDLVAASFGRGFYILDDISPLRSATAKDIGDAQAHIFDVKDAYWYVPKLGLYGQGHGEYAAENPPFGASFTYYIKDGLSSLKKERKKQEKENKKKKKAAEVPSWDDLDKEIREESSAYYLIVKDKAGKILKKMKTNAGEGLNRSSWDLSTNSKRSVRVPSGENSSRWEPQGANVLPGTYTVSISKYENGKEEILAGPKDFKVVPLLEPTLKGSSYKEIEEFKDSFSGFQKDFDQYNRSLNKNMNRYKAFKKSYSRADAQNAELSEMLYDFKEKLDAIDIKMNGYKSKGELREKDENTARMANRLGWSVLNKTYGPTATHWKVLNRSIGLLKEVKEDIDGLNNSVPKIEKALEAVGAPTIVE